MKTVEGAVRTIIIFDHIRHNLINIGQCLHRCHIPIYNNIWCEHRIISTFFFTHQFCWRHWAINETHHMFILVTSKKNGADYSISSSNNHRNRIDNNRWVRKKLVSSEYEVPMATYILLFLNYVQFHIPIIEHYLWKSPAHEYGDTDFANHSKPNVNLLFMYIYNIYISEIVSRRKKSSPFSCSARPLPLWMVNVQKGHQFLWTIFGQKISLFD